MIADLDTKIGGLERELRACTRQDEDAARLMTIPGIGLISAMALQAFTPPMESLRRGRDFSACLGLVPRQHTTGGKPRLGRISKMGQRDLRCLLVTGAMAVVSWAVRRGETSDPWLARMLARKPRKLVAVALANKMARIVWALMTKKESYRAPETGLLANDENLATLADLSGVWIDRVHARKLPRMIVLDMDSSVSPTHGDQQGTAYNGHFGCTCYHPLFVFNQFGDLERCGLRPGNVHSAHEWRDVLEPVVARYTATGHSGVTSMATPPSPHPKSTSFSKPRTSALVHGPEN